jgi:ATP-dependent DNA helicase RecG
MNLDTYLSSIGGIGYTFASRLQNLGLSNIRDLIYHFPFRYDDFSNVTNTLEAQIGEKVTLQGEIWSIRNIYTKTRKILTQAVFNDGNAPIELTWFNSQYLIKSIKVGDRLQISGKISKYKNKLSIIAPVWEKLEAISASTSSPQSYHSSAIRSQETINRTLHTGRLVAVYPETEGLSSKWLRTKINLFLPEVIGEIIDPLPDNIKGEMLSLSDAIREIHQPETLKSAQKARDRLGFDELFYIQLATAKTRLEWQKKPLIKPFEVNQQKVAEFIASLPFGLTGAQMRVISEISEDLKREQPMNRLVQGEVGSGKTVVAAVIAFIAHLNGLRTMYMAPTEILAFQHQANLQRILEQYGITVGLYTGSKKFTKVSKPRKGEALSVKDKEKVQKNVEPLNPHVVVGTHALLSDKLAVEDVGLIIVDEQQRFGVEQRSVLRSKAKVPHFLTMTATPIPRTVALTLYGDLDLSIIGELPKGRQEIKTHVVPKKKREDAYAFLHKQVKDGDQVYIITPLIEVSETLATAKAAIHEFERLQKEIFPDLRMGLLHGRLKPKEKDQVLQDFKNHQLDILVSTTVIEVGVDVPNATIMLIENAERFGLAQLHQLRGRVGRGVKQSYCFLFSGVEENEAYNRLKNLETISDGLKLAELDLKIRGSGQIFGKEQSGRFELKIASFSDLELIEKTRTAAKKLLSEDPTLEKHQLIHQELAKIAAQAAPD